MEKLNPEHMNQDCSDETSSCRLFYQPGNIKNILRSSLNQTALGEAGDGSPHEGNPNRINICRDTDRNLRRNQRHSTPSRHTSAYKVTENYMYNIMKTGIIVKLEDKERINRSKSQIASTILRRWNLSRDNSTLFHSSTVPQGVPQS